MDSGGRGRPRVIADTTRAVAACHCGVFMADMFMEDVRDADPALPGCGSNRRVEIHRFLIHDELGRPLLAREQKQLLLARVKQEILGSGCEEDVRLAALAPSKSRVFSVASLDSLASSPGGFGRFVLLALSLSHASSPPPLNGPPHSPCI